MNPIRIAREAVRFFRHVYEKKYLIYELTKRDFQQKYTANVLGLTWAVIDPLATMLIFWLVFGIGLRAGAEMGVPFVTYLITGIASYSFFQGALSQATNSLQSYSFLIKKVDFRVSILPLVKIFSELFVHCIVLAMAVLIIIGNGIYPNLYWLQVVYYMFAVSVLVLGLSWITSSVNLFFPDITNIVNIILRFFFFLTPLFWNPKMFPESVVRILKLNPMYYIVEGYRNSLLFGRPFWENWQYGLYFWAVAALFLLIGVVVFMRLRPHFADVV
jgi:ABC-type polysaccharide/polyol phosphate export permease